MNPLALMSYARSQIGNSSDPAVQVTAAIGYGNEVVTGVNKFPIGTVVPETITRDFINKRIVHAERNAIFSAAKHGFRLGGSEIYSSLFPCSQCAQAIAEAGIVRVFTHERPDFPEWNDDWQVSDQVFKDCGIEVVFLP